MKKLIIAVVLLTVCFQNLAYADVFGNGRQRPTTMRASANYNIAMPDPDTILAWLTAMNEYTGTREGFFYDFNEGDISNYFAATLYTIPAGVSLSAGLLDTDGYAVTIDYNLGQHIPSQGVSILEFLQYLYIGGGIGQRHLDKDNSDEQEWRTAYGLDLQMKLTF